MQPEKPAAQEATENLTRTVETLLSRGWVELLPPNQHPPMRLFATCRSLRNPEAPDGRINHGRFMKLGKFTYGFSEAHIINLIGEWPQGSGILVPIGHRDVKIARFTQSSIPTRANGNWGIRPRLLAEWRATFLAPRLEATLAEFDQFWRGNGIDIISAIHPDRGSNSAIDEAALASFYDRHGIPPETSWQKKGLGKLLVGLELELLRQRGVEKLELQSLSSELEAIFAKVPHTNDVIAIQNIPRSIYAALAAPFLPMKRP